MRPPRNAAPGRSLWWYPLGAVPLPEIVLAGLLWLAHRRQQAAYPDSWETRPSVGGDIELWLWLQCALLALVIAIIAPVFPANTYFPEIILLGYTVFAFLVGFYVRFWGVGVEIGLGLVAYSGRATLIAGLSLLFRRLLLQWWLGWRRHRG